MAGAFRMIGGCSSAEGKISRMRKSPCGGWWSLDGVMRSDMVDGVSRRVSDITASF